VSAPRRNFASDNVAGVAPAILAALAAANEGAAPSYGDDAWTARLGTLASEVFEREVAIVPVATGTAANALSVAVLAPPHGAVYCCQDAHLVRDECGAPEFYSGAKVIGLPTPDGKLRPEVLAEAVEGSRAFGVHHVLPAAVSVAQATEWGTVYSLAELGALADRARGLGLACHVDGARFANALAHLGCTPAEATWRLGVDALSLGATKNGALAAEAVVLFDPARRQTLEYRRMRAGHLWSKHRFLAAQLIAYLSDGLWLRNAAHANAMAARLSVGLAALPGVRLVRPTEANEVFVHLPDPLHAALVAAGFQYHRWPAADASPVYRLLASFETAAGDVDALLATARAAAAR
jgi:threonine aldolase